MNKEVVVIGGGAAGMEVAGQLADAGFIVSLVEKENRTGGHLNNWYKLFPDRRDSSEVKKYLDNKVASKDIRILTNSSIVKLLRKKGNISLFTNEGAELTADAVVVATGFDLFNSARKEEYGYGIYDNVISSADLEEMFRNGKIVLLNGKSPSTIGIVHWDA
jgi:heterodisulfide reductase subunit A